MEDRQADVQDVVGAITVRLRQIVTAGERMTMGGDVALRGARRPRRVDQRVDVAEADLFGARRVRGLQQFGIGRSRDVAVEHHSCFVARLLERNQTPQLGDAGRDRIDPLDEIGVSDQELGIRLHEIVCEEFALGGGVDGNGNRAEFGPFGARSRSFLLVEGLGEKGEKVRTLLTFSPSHHVMGRTEHASAGGCRKAKWTVAGTPFPGRRERSTFRRRLARRLDARMSRARCRFSKSMPFGGGLRRTVTTVLTDIVLLGAVET